MFDRLKRILRIPNYNYKFDGPIFVYQMGKVGSRSVYEALVDLRPTVPVYHGHVLEDLDNMAESIKKQFPNPVRSLRVIRAGKRLRQLIDSNPKQHWHIITLVRDPIARNVSRFFHSIEEVIPDIRRQFDSGTISCDEFLVAFLEKWERHSAAGWFDLQFKPVFDIDVYSRDFPMSQGFDIIQQGRFSVLLLRLEDLDARAGQALNKFLGIPDLKLKRENTSNEKWYKNIYREFVSKVVLPDEYLDEMYNSKFSQHFYSTEEIKTFRAKWSRAQT